MHTPIGTRILCVEDEPITRLAMARQFKRLGFMVDVAASAREALALMQSCSYPLIVTDLHMPDMGGLALIERARALAPHTQFIVVTGLQSLDLKGESISSDSVVAVLPKPWDTEALTSAVSRALKRHRAIADLGTVSTALVITGDGLLASCLEQQLRSARFDVKVAASIEIGTEVLQTRPDVIIADLASIVPPRFTGLTKLRHLSPGSSILVVSDERFEVLARQSLAYGASDYCSTDEVPLPIFQRTIRHAIDRAGSHRSEAEPAAPDPARDNLEAELRDALLHGRFALHYQPQRDLRRGMICGAEALLRMTRPDGTLARPDYFLPALERTDLMLEVGVWVLETACMRVAEWHRAGHPDMRIAVNLSVRQFERAGLVQAVLDATAKAGIAPSALELEITESVLMKDTELAAATLHGLEQTGARIAIDDFGTAGSSLAHLTRFRVDAVKIDRCFVSTIGREETGGSIASAIIGLAHRLGLEVIGEGIETPEELAFLRSEGCDMVQGFLIGRPTESWSPRSVRSRMGGL